MGCRGVAVLPEGMSRERFDWLLQWVADPADVIRTPGTESNVKEIYDKCAELEVEPDTVVFNQFSEFGNHLVHWLVTGRALARVVDRLRDRRPHLRVHAFVSATGSAGTIAAGDHLKERDGAQIVAVEALECPTLTENGFGEHNIQGIGDKHVPLIHNVMNTDAVVAISDRGTDRLNVLFNSAAGRRYLTDRRGVPEEVVAALSSFGLSSIANVLAAIRVAHRDRLGPDDLLVTVATDGARMYDSERDAAERRDYPDGFDETAAAEAFGTYILGGGMDRVTPLDEEGRRRVFNLGYFTWVEQQGVSIEAFVDRRRTDFWHGLRALVPAWDERIREFNERSGASGP
jgi:cysteine synthase